MSLEAFKRPGKFFRGNIHTHSNRSDGALAPEAVCALYRDAGYDFMALTDHFRKQYNYPLVDTKPFRTNRFTTIPGAELHAPANSHGELWHILAVGLPEDFAPNGEKETGIQLADRAIDAGAFVAIAHPQWSSLSMDDARDIKRAHAVEIYNHGCAVECSRGDGAIMIDALANEGRDVTAIATDDAHFRVADGFGGWVMVKAEENEPGALVAALKAGACYASQGPLIHNAEISGGILSVECSPAETVTLLGRGSRTVRRQGRSLTRADLPLERFADDWLRLVVIDAAGRIASTSPVRLGATGTEEREDWS